MSTNFEDIRFVPVRNNRSFFGRIGRGLKNTIGNLTRRFTRNNRVYDDEFNRRLQEILTREDETNKASDVWRLKREFNRY